MPSRRMHVLLERLVLGREYGWLDALIDYPYRWLGPRHRILFHDERVDPLLTLLATGDVGAAVAHWLHIRLDRDRRLQRLVRLYALLRGVRV